MSRDAWAAPAFPGAPDCHLSDQGLSKREYLAAHAPACPEWWPAPWVELEEKPYPPEGWTQAQNDDFLGWWDAGSDPQDPEVVALAETWTAIIERNGARSRQQAVDRLALWAVAYADALLTSLLKDSK